MKEIGLCAAAAATVCKIEGENIIVTVPCYRCQIYLSCWMHGAHLTPTVAAVIWSSSIPASASTQDGQRPLRYYYPASFL